MGKNNRIRIAKYLLFKYNIHFILPVKFMNFCSHLGYLSKWITNNRDVEMSSFPCKKFDYGERLSLYTYILNNYIGDKTIDYLEFGVSRGVSFRWWLENVQDEKSAFYGFDTFTGLPEDWGPFKKGDMSGGNEPPRIDDKRHKFYKGLFQQTLYDFLDSYSSSNMKVVHMDADLYSSTLFVLTLLSPYLKAGDILFFDEFNVPLHEFKAFKDWVNSFYVEYSVIGEVNNYYQVAILIEKNLR